MAMARGLPDGPCTPAKTATKHMIQKPQKDETLRRGHAATVPEHRGTALRAARKLLAGVALA
eukprot:16438075-Heterocapsa_arctica.AAC.1